MRVILSHLVELLCTVRTCHQPLTRDGRSYVCANRHSFDLARSGYLNLLQPQDRKSKEAGDSAAAVQARRRFLDAGHAAPLVRAIVQAVPLARGAPLLDVGCGEGHHLAAFRAAYEVDAHGVDLSVPAIDLAARRHRDCTWIVGNADRFLPYGSASFHTVASITARLNPDEFRRVLAPGGTLLIAIPGADDLLELREAVLGEAIERDRIERTIAMFGAFTLKSQHSVRHVATLQREAIVDVLTSSYRGLRARERERLESLASMEVTMSRDLLLFE
ncbi:MAG TPA: methyltransferase domain-containing protein [Thermoanaerobaculia bacterium]